MNPALVPETLRPFVPLFEKWGAADSDSGRYTLMDRAEASQTEMQELIDFHNNFSKVDKSTYEPWLNGPLGESHERAKVYFALLLVYCELEVQKR